MGNCGASRHAVASWADDGEWDEDADNTSSEEGDHHHHHHHHNHNHNHGRKEEVEEHHVSEEVTIRITRRQLQELMERRKQQAHGGVLGAVGSTSRRRSTEQLLADIMDSGEVRHHEDVPHWHWKPALQSIPEAAVESS